MIFQYKRVTSTVLNRVNRKAILSQSQSWGFTSCSITMVILGQVLSIATCGTRTHREPFLATSAKNYRLQYLRQKCSFAKVFKYVENFGQASMTATNILPTIIFLKTSRTINTPGPLS